MASIELPPDREALKRASHSWLNLNRHRARAPISPAIEVVYDVAIGDTRGLGDDELATLR